MKFRGAIMLLSTHSGDGDTQSLNPHQHRLKASTSRPASKPRRLKTAAVSPLRNLMIQESPTSPDSSSHSRYDAKGSRLWPGWQRIHPHRTPNQQSKVLAHRQHKPSEQTGRPIAAESRTPFPRVLWWRPLASRLCEHA